MQITDRFIDAVDDLRTRVAGRVVTPAEAEYDTARLAWNLVADQRPALVAIPKSGFDVVEIVKFAREHGLRVAPQGTGHNPGPMGSLDDTVLLKTHEMRGLEIDPDRKVARVEAGVEWAEVTAPASEHGLAPLAGSSPNVGVVGYTLGGGMSWLGRKHGLAANSVVGVEVVLADGRYVRADKDNEPDLFWAIRGGGGSFAVVTAIEFKLYDAPHVYGGVMMFPIERAADVVPAWRDWTETAPDEITTSLRLLNLPPLEDIPEPLRGKSWVAIDGAYLGPEAEAVEVLAPLRALGPVMDMFAAIPPLALSHIHMDPEEPVPGLGDHFMMESLDDDAIAGIIELAGEGSGTPLLMFELRQLGGAFDRPAADGGAVSALSGAYAVFQAGMVMAPEMGAALEDVFEVTRERLAPYIGGRPYLNFAERPTEMEGVYGAATYARLQAIKADVDPDDVIRANHPIAPAA